MKWVLLLVLFSRCGNYGLEIIDLIPDNGRMDSHITLTHTISEVKNHKAFQGFGEMLLPWNDNSTYYTTLLKNVATLMPYHSHIHPEVVLSALNHMIDEEGTGNTIFYSFYSDQQRQEDLSKEKTGIFYFRGEPDAPFAVVCPGGGFSYVGSLHEGFPLAHEISKSGLNAFVIRYRTGSEQKATEDLAAALSYILENAQKFDVHPKGYSLWGGSAGARMVGNLALKGATAFGGVNVSKPAAVFIAYTGQSSYSSDFPPVFITVAANDRIVDAATVDRRVENLKRAGVEVEYKRYKTAGHGFGTGEGTDAEGWMEDAILFWKKQIRLGTDW